jgi:hypothetical protein
VPARKRGRRGRGEPVTWVALLALACAGLAVPASLAVVLVYLLARRPGGR